MSWSCPSRSGWCCRPRTAAAAVASLLGLRLLWRHLAGRNVAEVAGACSGRPSAPAGAAVAVVPTNRRVWCHSPTAVVEGCWLGEGVTVGAGAVLRASVLADGASVEDLAMVEGASGRARRPSARLW